MPKRLISLVSICVFSIPLMAQRGNAPPGYYPVGYSGSVFTGKHESTGPDSQELALVYTKGTKSERFVGRFEAPCTLKTKDGIVHAYNPSEAKEGTVLTAYYRTVTKKSGHQKSTENLVLAISFAEIDGKKIPEAKRLIIFCLKETSLRFMAFDDEPPL